MRPLGLVHLAVEEEACPDTRHEQGDHRGDHGVADRDRALLRRTIILPERAKQGLHMQRAIIDAMCAGDAEGAERLKRESIMRAREAVIRYRGFII